LGPDRFKIKLFKEIASDFAGYFAATRHFWRNSQSNMAYFQKQTKKNLLFRR